MCSSRMVTLSRETNSRMYSILSLNVGNGG